MWIISKGLITYSNNGRLFYPSASEILHGIDNNTIVLDGQAIVFPSEQLGLRFSKIGLNVLIELSILNDEIVCLLYAKHKGKLYPIESLNNGYSDYIIIDNTWHYLSHEFDAIKSLANDLGILLSNPIDFRQYMSLRRNLESLGINFEDKVKSLSCINKSASINKNKDSLLNADLFPYQASCVNWMSFMLKGGCGCLLGDEMGLGKTIQVIALLGQEKKKGNNKHFLVIAPVSLLVNWSREIEKFYPSLTTLIHHGSDRSGYYADLLNYDVVIMSYSNVKTDLSLLNMIEWDIVVLDEAQNIKNPYATRTKSVKKIKRKHSIAVTGTPFENHVTDLWSITDYIMPGYLGTLSEFESCFTDDTDSALRLEKYISPIMIRRKVCDVAIELPDRINVPQAIAMTDEEAGFYENERASTKVRPNLMSLALDKIQRLRMFCTHPQVYNPQYLDIDPACISNKYNRLCEILEEIFLLKEKAVVFTSFNRMFDILENDIPSRFLFDENIQVLKINGSTPSSERQGVVDRFTSIKGPALLVLNPIAAGTGLNITCANHVIHYNLEWNPAVEDQASARVYRKGQTKTVFVYRLFYTDTIEEIINDRIERKRDIFNIAVIGSKGAITERDDLIKAFSISPYRRIKND